MHRSVSWFLAVALLAGAARVTQARDVLNFHYDQLRTGWNNQETVLTPANVNSTTFGRLWYSKLDAQTYAAPLVVTGLQMDGVARDVVYAATENNTVYALDAYSGAVLWQNHLAPPVSQNDFNAGCPNINGIHGITSTPVIDRTKNVLYTVALVKQGSSQQYQFFALDLTTGAKKDGYPIVIKGKDRTLTFNALQNTQRAALTLVNGVVYVCFSSRCDIGEYHGWVVGVPVDTPGALRLFSPAITKTGAGIWGTAGPAADDQGNLYVVTGNLFGNSLDLANGNIGESFVRLSTADNKLTFSKLRADYYIPTNHQDLDNADADMGGSSSIGLPDHTGSTTPHLLVCGGKDGNVYLVNRDNLGGMGAQLSMASMNATIRTSPASFKDDAGTVWAYATAENGGNTGNTPKGIAAFKLTIDSVTKKSELSYTWTSSRALVFPGTPAVSSDPDSKNAITWVIDTNKSSQHTDDSAGQGILLAFDAKTGKELYASTKNAARDGMGQARKFTAPIIANGRVFLSGGIGNNRNNLGIVSYGLIPEKGDVYSDGKTDVSDVVLTLRGIVGLYPWTPLQTSTADMNADGQTDVIDVVELLKKVVL